MSTITEFLLGTVLMITAAVAVAADIVIAPDANSVAPIQVGDHAPVFTVSRVDGSAFTFDPSALARPTMLITFRGGWCPFCNLHLQELRHVVPELEAAGYEVLFLSADPPADLYASLAEENRDLDYTILSDHDMQAAGRLGVAFVNRRADGSTSNLPVPSVFVIDKAGIVRFAHVDPNFRVRLSAEEVRAAATAVAP